MVIRTLINYDSGWDSKADLLTFFEDMRTQAIHSAGGKDPSVIVNPNCWPADKTYYNFNDIGFGFCAIKWCNEHMNGGDRQTFVHARNNAHVRLGC